jgi:hypothetical protein
MDGQNLIKMEERAAFRRIIDVRGVNVQIDKVPEELAELSQAVLKWKHEKTQERMLALIKERADVKIVLGELDMICGDVEPDFNEMVQVEYVQALMELGILGKRLMLEQEGYAGDFPNSDLVE